MPAEPLFPDPSREFLDDDQDAPIRHARRPGFHDPVTQDLTQDLTPDAAPGASSSGPASTAIKPMPTDVAGSSVAVVQRRPNWAVRLGGVSLAVMVGIAGAVLLLGWLLTKTVGGLNPFHETTTERSGPAVVTAIHDLKTFHAASGYYELVIDQKKSVTNLPSFLAGERVLFVAAGTVDATVDFSKLDASAIVTNAERTQATITLPAPEIGQAHLDLDRSYVADRQLGLRDRLKDAVGDSTGSATDVQEIYQLAEQRLTAAGTQNNELRDRAEANTRAMLTSLLGSLGYTDVKVTFTHEP